MRHSSLFHFFALLGVGIGLLYWQLLFQHKAIYWRDVLHVYFPFLEFFARSIKAGDFPLWNPYIFTGVPQMAALEPPLFYPATWLFIVFSFTTSTTLGLILHHLLAGLGTYLLCREMTFSKTSASAAACIFTFSGVLVSMNNVFPLLWTCAWIPIIFWGCHRVCHTQTPQNLLLFTFTYALQILSGHLEIVYFTSILLLFYTLIQVWSQKPLSFRPVILIIIGLGLGIGLTAIQLFPAFEFVSQSVRQSGVGLKSALTWSFHPLRIPTLFIPDLLGDIFSGDSLTPLFGEEKYGRTFLLFSTYLGLPTLTFALSTFIYHRQIAQKMTWWFWWITTGMTLLLAMGNFTSIYGFFYHVLPGLQFFRYPVKLLIFTTFSCSILAGYGIELLLSAKTQKRGWVVLISTELVILLSIWMLLHFNNRSLAAFLPGLIQRWSGISTTSDILPWAIATFQHMEKQVFLAALLLCVLALYIYLFFRRTAPYLLSFVLYSLLFLDLIPPGLNTVWVVDSDFFKTTPSISIILKQEKANNFQTRLMKAGEIQEIPMSFLNHYQNTPLLAHAIYFMHAMNDNLPLLFNFQNAYAHWPARPNNIDMLYGLYSQSIHLGFPEIRNSIESMLAVRYLYELNSNPEIKKYIESHPQNYRLIQQFPTYHASLWENRNWQPRAHFKNQAYVVNNHEQAINTLLTSQGNGFNPRKHVILVKNKAYEEAQKRIPTQEARLPSWQIPSIVNSGNNRVEITFETNTSGYLVLADNHLPGWRATDNGQSTPILDANFMQRAIRVAPGKHRIVFKYWPRSLTLGLLVTLLSIPGFILFVWLARKYRLIS